MNMTRLKKTNTISTIVALIVVLLPIVRYYDMPLTSVSVFSFFELFLLLFLVIFGARKKMSTRMHRCRVALVCFLAYSVIATFLASAFLAKSFLTNSFLSFIFMGVIISLLIGIQINKRIVFRVYEIVALGVCLVYIFQLFLMLVGIRVSFKIPFLSFSESWGYLERYHFGMNDSVPTSLFSERAHFAEFLIPYLIICLFNRGSKKVKSKVFAVAVSVIVLSTLSGNGVVLVLLSWVFYFLLSSSMSPKKVFVIIMSALAILALYNLLNSIPSFNKLFSTLFVNTTGMNAWTKADYRIYRGFDYYRQIPAFNQIFGIGYDNLSIFSDMFNISSIYDKGEMYFGYLSAFFQILIYTGCIGLFLFAIHLYYFQSCNAKLCKGLLFLFVAICVSTETLFEVYHLLFALLMVASSKNIYKPRFFHETIPLYHSTSF